MYLIRKVSFTGLSPWYDELPSSPIKYLLTFVIDFVGKPLWFLPTMLVCGALIALAWNKLDSSKKKIFYMVIAIIGFTVCFHIMGSRYLEQYFLFYAIGVLGGIKEVEEQIIKRKSTVWIMFSMLLVVYLLMQISNIDIFEKFYIKRTVGGLALCIIFVKIGVGLSKFCAKYIPKLQTCVKYIGVNSLEFYLVEFIFLNIGIKFNIYCSIITIFICCLIFTTIVVYFLKSKSKTLNKLLFGN